jgi:hypothetical protein
MTASEISMTSHTRTKLGLSFVIFTFFFIGGRNRMRQVRPMRTDETLEAKVPRVNFFKLQDLFRFTAVWPRSESKSCVGRPLATRLSDFPESQQEKAGKGKQMRKRNGNVRFNILRRNNQSGLHLKLVTKACYSTPGSGAWDHLF